MATTRRIKAPTASIYTSKEDADKAIAAIGQLQRDIAKIANAANTRVARITEAARVAREPLQKEIDVLVKELALYGEQNRTELTNDNATKTVKFAHGTFQWRFTPVAITIQGADDVIKRLKARRLRRFITIKESVNKEAMGRERKVAERVEGVSFGNHEEFIITPTATNLEIPTKIKAKKPADSSASD